MVLNGILILWMTFTTVTKLHLAKNIQPGAIHKTTSDF